MGGGVALALTAALLAACSSSSAASPGCTVEGAVHPYGDAGIVPARALPNGFPCATGAVCYAAVDDCAADWPDAATAPVSGAVTPTPFMCDCIQGVWSCEAETETAPVCPGGGGGDGGMEAGG